jgi:lysine 2,3-aminomutase
MKKYQPSYITNIEKINQSPEQERDTLKAVTSVFAFRTNSYYLNLIDWSNPDDPIKKIIIPRFDELEVWGKLDASHEVKYTKVPGLEHKYQYTALMLVTDVCGGFCRFCFRKRLFMEHNEEISRDVTQALNYIKSHTEINNVLLTGGDPLLLSTRKLEEIFKKLREMEHVKIIRIGSKMPAFNPYRILNDSDLIEVLDRYSTEEKKIYLMTHFNHPNELTVPAIKALNAIQSARVLVCNQTPLLQGINDGPDILAELFNRLSYLGVQPYYLFQCRPTVGNKSFSVPIEEGLEIFEQARMKCSGLAKKARYVMSHATGKIEILGRTDEQVFFRYHRAADPEEKARFLVFQSNPNAYWFDDYLELIEDYCYENPFYSILYNDVKGA